MRCRTKLALLGMLLAVGCASRPKPQAALKPPPATRPVARGAPLIDISRGGGGLPLENSSALASHDQLVQGLRKGYERRIDLNDSKSWITLIGSDHRSLDVLRIDLTNQPVRDNYKPVQYEKPGQPEPGIQAKQFEYLAWPLLYKNGATRWRISATDAHFGLLRDKAGNDTLILADASEGSFEFSVLLADLKPMLLGAMNSRSPMGFVVKDLDVQFTSQNPRNLAIEVRVEAMVLLVPTTFRIHSRVDIDQWCNAKLSEVTCTGEDPGGALVAALAMPALEKQQEKLVPLVKWPGDKLVVKDVQFKLDESLTIRASFGRDEAQ